MKKLLKALLVLALALGLCGCKKNNSSSEEYDHISIVYDPTSGNPDYILEVLNDLLLDYAGKDFDVELVIADGNPSNNCQLYSLGDENIKTGFFFGVTSDVKKSEEEYNLNEMYEELKSMAPKEEECDLIGAIGVASKNFDSDDHNLLIVISNKLSTVDPLDMSSWKYLNNLSGNVDAIVKDLSLSNNVYDLTNVDVIMYSAGVDGNQKNLTATCEKALDDFYTAYFTACNANIISLDEQIDGNENTNDLPAVSLVNIKSDATLPDILVSFNAQCKVGETTFVNQEEAIEALAPCKQYYEDYDLYFYVVGCAGVGEEEYQQQLSEGRAEDTKNILMNEYGIPEDHIITIGMSYDNPWHSNVNSDNTNVVVLNYNSTLATYIIYDRWQEHVEEYQ